MLKPMLITLKHITAQPAQRLCIAKLLLLFAAYLFSAGDVQAQNSGDIFGPQNPPQQSPVLTPAPTDEPSITTEPGTDDGAPLSCPGSADGSGNCPPTQEDPTEVIGSVQPRTSLGNPINLMSGNKSQPEVDFKIPGAQLSFRRMYNSVAADTNVGLGQGWTHTYAVSLFDAGNGIREIIQSNGSRLRFTPDGTDENGYPLMRGNRPNLGYVIYKDNRHEWHLPDGRTLTFNGSYLITINWPDQRNLTLYYRSRRLHSVTDETGRVLRLNYYAGGRAGMLNSYDRNRFGEMPGHLASLTLPDGSEIHYDYDNLRNLTRARFSDNTSREYHYEDETYPNHLTGLTDRTGVRFASWSYDEHGRAISSEHADGVERVTLAYPDPKEVATGNVVQTIITNSLGYESQYTWQQPRGESQPRLLASSGAGCATCPPTGMEYVYDEQGRLSVSASTGQGNAQSVGNTRYLYDQQGRISESRVSDASGTERLLERYEYDGDNLKPTRTYRPSINPDAERMTQFDFNDQQLPIRIIERGYRPVLSSTTDLSSTSVEVSQYTPIERITTLTYNDNQQLIAIDGPREDIDDVTRLEYDASMRLSAILSPLSPVLRLTQYDTLGRLLSYQLGTQREVLFTRDGEGRVIESRQGERVNRFTYDANGRMSSISDSDGRTVRMTHDAAGQLVSVIDDLENEQVMGYDTEGRLVAQQKLGSDGLLIHSLETLFDENGQQRQFTKQQLTQDGNLDTRSVDVISTDAAGESTSSFIDGASGRSHQMNISQINRLVEHVRADGAQTSIGIDALDNVTSVEDARGNVTRDFRDDFGRSTILVNADTGVQIQRHDAAGNLIFRQDAQGRTSQYSYDAANRLIERTDDDGITRWQWDAQSGGLAEVSNEDSVERFSYNISALLSSHVRIIDGHSFETTYRYDARDRLISTRLPDGQTLQHHYHDSGPNRGQLESISRGRWGGLSEEALVTDIDLDARDGDSGYVSAAGVSTQQQYSANGQIRSVQVGSVLDLQYNVDNGGRIVGITENGDEQRFAYNADGLMVADTVQGLFSYGYDNVGNRTSRRVRQAGELSEEEIYRYAEGGEGNRLLERIDTVAGVSQPYTYNATGSPVQRGQLRYEYDAKEQLTALYSDEQLLARYAYNGFGERIKKVVYSQGKRPTVTYFLYSNSTLVAEADQSGEITTQYQYLNDHRPVLMLQGDQAYVIHTDHLGTPRVVSDEQGDIRWQASYTPFGKAIITQADIDLPLRFPGQYADAESGTHYNYLRDYDPGLGRYLRSDPIGLGGGINTYAYVASNPLGAIDPLGLQVLPSPSEDPALWELLQNNNLDVDAHIVNGPANQPIPPPRVGVPATTVTESMRRIGKLIKFLELAHDIGYVGAAIYDALVLAPRDQEELLRNINRFRDPDDPYVPNEDKGEHELNRDGIYALGKVLRTHAAEYVDAINSSPDSCENIYDAQLLLDAQVALGIDPISQLINPLNPLELTPLELEFTEYLANGGTLTFDEWLDAGSPIDDHDYSNCSGNLVVGGETRNIPRCSPTNGRWSDPTQPGNSTWIPARDTNLAIALAPRRVLGIVYRNGYPVFEPFAYTAPGQTKKAIVPVPDLRGDDNTYDFREARDEYRRMIGNPTWRAPSGWTWHHHEDCRTMILVPTDIHGEARHQGGASNIRNTTCSS